MPAVIKSKTFKGKNSQILALEDTLCLMVMNGNLFSTYLAKTDPTSELSLHSGVNIMAVQTAILYPEAKKKNKYNILFKLCLICQI